MANSRGPHSRGPQCGSSQYGWSAVFCGQCGEDLTYRTQHHVWIPPVSADGRAGAYQKRVMCDRCYRRSVGEQSPDVPPTWADYLAGATKTPQYLLGIEQGPGGWIAYRVPNNGAWPYWDVEPPSVVTPVCASPEAAYDQLVEAVVAYRRLEE